MTHVYCNAMIHNAQLCKRAGLMESLAYQVPVLHNSMMDSCCSHGMLLQMHGVVCMLALQVHTHACHARLSMQHDVHVIGHPGDDNNDND